MVAIGLTPSFPCFGVNAGDRSGEVGERAVCDVVVIGGGFAGFWAAVAARRFGGPHIAITLVTAQPDLVMRPRLYEADPASLSLRLAEPLAMVDVELVVDRVTEIDPDSALVELQSGHTIRFGTAVLATGSRAHTPDIPGVDELFSIDTQSDAIEFDEYLARVAAQPEVRIAIIGAGFTGIELALELPARLQAHGRTSAHPAADVVLVDRASAVGSELGAGPRPIIEAALKEAGVALRLGVTITGLRRTSFACDDGTETIVDAVVLCTGLRAADLDRSLGGPTDSLGRYEVSPTLQHATHVNLFITGDIASVDTGNGHLALQSCQHALQLGRIAGENAARQLRGDSLVEYYQPEYVTCLDLGGAGAVLTKGWERTVVETGSIAKARKQRINQDVIMPDLTDGRVGLLAQSETKARSHPTAT